MPPTPPELVVVRGGGDIATGIVWRLNRAGWPVVVTELARPLTVRRRVALSSAVLEGTSEVEGLVAERVADPRQAIERLSAGVVPVVIAPDLPSFDPLRIDVLVDARLTKRDIDTSVTDAPLVIGVGPGFTVGTHCHAVIETQRGHRLGRCLWDGAAAPDTGVPGTIGGESTRRVLRATTAGTVEWRVEIGDRVVTGQRLGQVKPVASLPVELPAPFDGIVRGLIADGTEVPAGLKIGDVDPRSDRRACFEISDKALAIAGGVVEAILSRMARR